MENRKVSATAGRVIRCKAAICRGSGRPLEMEEIEVDPPAGYEVRIKILCTSLCHTDITFWKIFGHEAVGVVESVGDRVEEVEEGDMVLPSFLQNCRECRDCKSSKGNACSVFTEKVYDGMPRDGKSRFRLAGNGEVVYHFLWVSSFTEFTVVDVAHMVKISQQIPADKAYLLSCGVSTGVGAAWKVADVEEGSTVAVFGLGVVGLAVAEGARCRGASKIIGVNLNPDKFQIGRKYGVTDFVNPASLEGKTVSEVIKELTEGGADYCFECVGLASTMEDAFLSTREGSGKTVILGVEVTGAKLALDLLELMKGRRVLGSLFGGLKPKSDIPLLVQKYTDRELNLDGFVTHEVRFGDINKAFELLLEGKSLRCIIWMDD